MILAPRPRIDGAMPHRCANLHRYDSKGVHAYVVQFTRNKKRVRIVFGDAAHGSRGDAYRQASKVVKAIKQLLDPS